MELCSHFSPFPQELPGHRKRHESICGSSPVLVAIQVAPGLFSLRGNQTRGGHAHCCHPLEPDSAASFSSCLEACGRRAWSWPSTHSYCSGAKSELTRNSFHLFLTKHGSPGVWFFLLPKQNSFIMTLLSFFLCVHCLFTISADLAISPLLVSHILTLGFLPFGTSHCCGIETHTQEEAQMFSFETRSPQSISVVADLVS